MNYREIYQKAYAYMGEKVIEQDCGMLCNSHCCRNYTEDGEHIGIYLMPFEYEGVFQGTELEERFRFEKHTSKNYFIPPKVKYLYYFHCDKTAGCFRERRPIQCRSYPYEPHLENGKLSLVIEKEQIHQCPLLDRLGEIREEFIEGVYRGWETLLQIPEVQHLVQYDSMERNWSENIRLRIKG